MPSCTRSTFYSLVLVAGLHMPPLVNAASEEDLIAMHSRFLSTTEMNEFQRELSASRMERWWNGLQGSGSGGSQDNTGEGNPGKVQRNAMASPNEKTMLNGTSSMMGCTTVAGGMGGGTGGGMGGGMMGLTSNEHNVIMNLLNKRGDIKRARNDLYQKKTLIGLVQQQPPPHRRFPRIFRHMFIRCSSSSKMAAKFGKTIHFSRSFSAI